jgi:hypothetical protein
MNKFAYLVAASALAVSAFGQGQINLNNRGLALVNDASGKPLTGTSFLAQVWYGASAATVTTSSFAPAPFRASTTTFPGTWNPSAAGGPGNLGTLTGFGPGSTVTLRVAVWDSAVAGAGAASALAGAVGTGLSDTFTYTIPTDPLAIPGGLENMKSFSLVAGGGPVIPEPTTIALGTLGAAALLWRRRK